MDRVKLPPRLLCPAYHTYPFYLYGYTQAAGKNCQAVSPALHILQGLHKLSLKPMFFCWILPQDCQSGN